MDKKCCIYFHHWNGENNEKIEYEYDFSDISFKLSHNFY